MSDLFYILSVDGGGFRGAFSAHLLKRMEETWSFAWRDRFQMFAGTSTGSILAAGLAAGLAANPLCQGSCRLVLEQERGAPYDAKHR